MHDHTRAGRGPRPGGGRGRDEAELPSADGAAGWFAGRLPDDWFDGEPEVTADRDELVVVGRLAGIGAGEDERAAEREAGRLARFREDTREQRMQIAREAEGRFGRRVAWGAQAGQSQQVFTSLAVPVMTRLRQPERTVLDTLVEGGVARSRADALAWCVKLVGQHADDWLTELRSTLEAVQRVRGSSPV